MSYKKELEVVRNVKVLCRHILDELNKKKQSEFGALPRDLNEMIAKKQKAI